MSNRETNFVKIMNEICVENDIVVNRHMYDWVFELEKDGVQNSIFGYQFGINSSTSTLICSDKAATSQVLVRHKIPSVFHHLFMSPTLLHVTDEKHNWSRINDLMEKHKTLVCKQNDGTGGANVFKVTNAIELEQVTQTILSKANAMAVTAFEDIEFEYRVVMLDGEARMAFYKEVPVVMGDGMKTLRQLVAEYIVENPNAQIPSFSVEELSQVIPNGKQKRINWKHNLGQGACPHIVEDEKLLNQLSDLASRTTKAIGIHFASVDIIKTSGGLKVLEVNSGVMLESFSKESRRYYEIAKDIYRDAILMMFK